MENASLTKQQREHRAEIVALASEAIWDKYTAGAIEHNTNLKQDTTVEMLLNFAIEEAVDQMVYLLTLKQKLDENESRTTGK